MPLYMNHRKIGGVAVKTNTSSGGSGGTDTSDATLADGSQMLSPYTAYSKGKKITGTIPSKAAATITPGNTDQVIESGQYLSGKQTVKGDANLLPENIKSGVSIFGVDGSLSQETTPQVEQATPSIKVDASGLITASATQQAGKVAAGTKSATKQLTTQGAKTVTPGTSEQTAVSSGVFTTGEVKVAAMPSGALGTPSVDASGLVTAQVSTSGYLSSGTKKTLQLNTQGAKTITPGDSEQVAVEAGVYTTGQIKVAAHTGGGGGAPSTIVAGDTPVLSSDTLASTINSTSMTNTGISVTIKKAGTYRFKFGCGRTSTSGTWTTQLYKNGSAVSGATVTWSSYQGTCKADVTCAAGDVISIYGRSRSSTYRLIVGQLVACIDWDTGL